MKIDNRQVGPGCAAYIVAEMSANHSQNFAQAVQIVQAAKEGGADAIKLQTYTPDTLTIDCDSEHFRIGKGTIWEGKNLYQLYQEAYTPWDWQPKLKQVADDCGLHCFSSPFDRTAVDFLERMGVPAYKIASFELVDLPLIRYVARTGKPLIMSTGMASLEEIKEAIEAAREGGAREIALLKCTSAYPSSPEEMNLRTIPDMVARFGVPVGLSDHTMSIAVPVAAVTLGACIVEKHLTLSRSIPGPDSAFSLEPSEFKQMVEAIRMTEKGLGHVNYEPTKSEEASRVFRHSLFVIQDIKEGEAFTEQNVRSIRPGYGLPPRHLPMVLTRKAACRLKAGTPLTFDHLAPA
jgi:N-acetylneuraminate synthase